MASLPILSRGKLVRRGLQKQQLDSLNNYAGIHSHFVTFFHPNQEAPYLIHRCQILCLSAKSEFPLPETWAACHQSR